MREVDLGSGRALLIKQHGEFSAMGHKCPHYGAPLVKGGATNYHSVKIIAQVMFFPDFWKTEKTLFAVYLAVFCVLPPQQKKIIILYNGDYDLCYMMVLIFNPDSCNVLFVAFLKF